MHEIVFTSGEGLKEKRENVEMAGKGKLGEACKRHTLRVAGSCDQGCERIQLSRNFQKLNLAVCPSQILHLQ